MACRRCTDKKKVKVPAVKVNRGIKNPRKIESVRERKARLRQERRDAAAS